MRTATILLALTCSASIAWAGHYKSPDGYSLDYPDHWVLIAKENQQAGLKAAQDRGIDKTDVNFSDQSCLLLNAALGQSGNTARVAMYVSPGQSSSANESNLPDFKRGWVKGMQESGFSVSDVDARVCRAGGRQAYRVSCRTTMAGGTHPLRQILITVPGTRKSCVLTCTVVEGDYARYEASFEQIISTLQVDDDFPLWLLLVIVGVIAVLGGVVILVVVLVLRKKSARPAMVFVPGMTYPGVGLPAAAAGPWPAQPPVKSVGPPPLPPRPRQGPPISKPVAPTPAPGPQTAAPAAPGLNVAQPPSAVIRPPEAGEIGPGAGRSTPEAGVPHSKFGVLPMSPVAPRPAGPVPADAVPEVMVITCPSCGQGLRAKRALSGKRCRCPKCGADVLVP